MLALGVGNAWAETVYFEGFEENHRTSGNNSYTATANTYGDWTLTYADAVTSGGPLTGTAHVVMRVAKNTINSPSLVSKALLSDNVSVTKVSWNCKGNTAQTLKVSYSTDGSNWVEKYSAKLTTSKANKSFTLDNVPGPIYLKFVVSVASTTSSNRDANIDDITIEGTALSTEETAVKTLKSIEVTPKTINYETGDVFKFDGTCTATYSVTKNGEPQDDETAVVTPTTVSTPDMSTAGTKEITVTYTEDDVTVTDTYEINITENVVTPGEYTGNLNNVFFGCATGNIAAEQSGKFDDVLVVAGCKSSASTKTSYQSGHVRFYADSYLTLSVPVGYVIKSIVFTADGTWNGSITASAGTYDNNTKTWTGNAQEVKFSFAAQNRIKSVKVTYAADVKYAVNITTPSNGTLVVTDGSAVLADGALVYEGTKLVVTPTPNAGYVFESLTVDGTPVDLTEGSYNLTMPAANVTIAATFKENEKPAATLTLSKNGVTEDITGYKQDDKVTLPSITSDCLKAFVGWSAEANCAIEPEYKAGDEYTLASTTQTLYAVYATVGGGGEATAANTLSSNGWANQSQHKSLQIDENVKAEITGTTLTNSGKYYDSGTNWRLYQNENPNLTISTTLGELKSITFTFTNDKTGTLLYNGAQLTSGTAVEVSGTSAIFTVGNSTASVTNGQIRISKIEVVYTGGVSYSNYSTTCVAALDEPVFSVEGGENEAKTITLTATEGTIYYTLDGSTPTASSEKYTTPIVLDECGEHTIKAIAISSESESPVASATYTISLPILANSETDPYTETEAVEVYNGGCYDGEELVYVKGTVKTATFYSSGTYTITLTNGFQFYKFYKDGSKTLFADGEINKGDVLVACGKLSKYNTTYQLAEGCYLVERIPYAGEKTDISNTEATAYTVDQAFALIADVSSDLTKEVYVKGLVAVAPTSNPTDAGKMTYSISDDGEKTGKVLKVYLGLGIDGAKFTSKDDVKQGDYVVAKGKLLDYSGTYELTDNQLVQHLKAATITIADITMEVGETKTIAATITPAAAETAVVYTIKENTDNAISLTSNTITASAVGTAIITATIATAAEYMGKTVDFTITVTPESTSDEVVILAELEGKWYAMKGAVPSGKSNQLDAIEVTYFNGTLYNVPDEVKASITWTRSVVDGKATFVNNGKYLKGGASTDLTLVGTVDNNCKWMWNDENGYYTTNTSGTIRTFLYRVGYNFKNYRVSQAGKEDVNGNYSELPVVTAPVYATGTPVYTRTIASGDYGTICLPYASSNYSGAEFYEISWMELEEDDTTPKSIWLDQVNGNLVAGKPYIFKATSTVLTVNCAGTAVADPVAGEAGLVGTFKDIKSDNTILEGNYMISGNQFLLCPTGCWLNANRAYIDATIIANHTTKKAVIPGRRRVCLGETSENEATGFENIVAPEGQAVKAIVNGQLIIIRDGVKYNIQGQKL